MAAEQGTFGSTGFGRQHRRGLLCRSIVSRFIPENHALAVELAALPLEMRGFGHIKEATIARAKAKEAQLLARLRTPEPEPALVAAE